MSSCLLTPRQPDSASAAPASKAARHHQVLIVGGAFVLLRVFGVVGLIGLTVGVGALVLGVALLVGMYVRHRASGDGDGSEATSPPTLAEELAALRDLYVKGANAIRFHERFHRASAGQRQGPPGEFVSPELRSDCARFLEDIKARAGRSATVPILPVRTEAR